MKPITFSVLPFKSYGHVPYRLFSFAKHRMKCDVCKHQLVVVKTFDEHMRGNYRLLQITTDEDSVMHVFNGIRFSKIPHVSKLVLRMV